MLCGLGMPKGQLDVHKCPHGQLCSTLDYCRDCKPLLRARLEANAKTKPTLEFWREVYEAIDECT